MSNFIDVRVPSWVLGTDCYEIQISPNGEIVVNRVKVDHIFTVLEDDDSELESASGFKIVINDLTCTYVYVKSIVGVAKVVGDNLPLLVRAEIG